MSKRHARSWRQPQSNTIVLAYYTIDMATSGRILGDPWTFNSETTTYVGSSSIALSASVAAPGLAHFVIAVESGGYPPYTFTWDTLTGTAAGHVVYDPAFATSGTLLAPYVRRYNTAPISTVLNLTAAAAAGGFGMMAFNKDNAGAVSSSMKFTVIDARGNTVQIDAGVDWT